MESVVKAVRKIPVTDDVPEEGELKENFDNQPNSAEKKNDENPRKRQREPYEEKHDRTRRDDNHRVGRRYWDDEHEERDSRQRFNQDRRDERRRDSGRNEDRRADSKNEERNNEEPKIKRKPKEDELITTRTGGAYIPPARLRMMQAEVTDKNSVAFQRLAWEALKKSIHGLINKVNVSNIKSIISSLIRENLVRGRGLLCRSIIQAQAASPTFTNVYAALVAVINTKFPNIGELLLHRLILQFRRGYRRNDKNVCLSSTTFIAHLVNQQVTHEVLALEILTLLLENATDDSVEIAINFLKQCGQKLGEVSPRGLTAIFDRLRHVLHEADLDKRVKYAIEVLFQVRKDGFKDNPAVVAELDLTEENDQFTHMLSVEESDLNSHDILNVFQHDPNYEANEQKYQAVKKEILGSDDDESGDSSDGGDEDDESASDEEGEAEEKDNAIVDETETNLIALRRTIYLTIQSSLDHNECAHKMMKMQLKPGQEVELCHMILDCCAQQRTYEKFFGLLAQRFCQINKNYIGPFEQIFKDTYDTIHRLDTNKLRNVGKMFAHLLFTDAISWDVFSHIRLTEVDTTSSSRIFLKILFQELAEYMGLPKLNARLSDPTLQTSFEGIFPRDDPRNTRFAINYFTSIGLGGLTDELREFLRTHPKPPPVTTAATQGSELSAAAAKLLLEESSSDSDSSSSSSSSSDSDDSSDSSNDSSSSSASSEKSKKKSRKDRRGSKSPKERQVKPKGRDAEGKDGNSRMSAGDLKSDNNEDSKRHKDLKRRDDEDLKIRNNGDSTNRGDTNYRKRDNEDSRRREDGDSRRREDGDSRRRDDGDSRRRDDGDSRRRDDGDSRRRDDGDSRRRDDGDSRRRDDERSKKRDVEDSKRSGEEDAGRKKDDESRRRTDDESRRRRQEEDRRRGRDEHDRRNRRDSSDRDRRKRNSSDRDNYDGKDRNRK